MKYFLTIDTPKEYYHESHRPSHFLSFANVEEGKRVGRGVLKDREDAFF
jgi:pre-mRNA-processing factor 8